eukprot:2195533-Pyramimonas_sp.AAC.1
MTNIVFIDKSDRGVRPIGLLAFFAKIWSRSVNLCSKSGSRRIWKMFWGVSSTTTCERAGRIHNLLGSYCKGVGFESGTALLDLSKFYEHIAMRICTKLVYNSSFPYGCYGACA